MTVKLAGPSTMRINWGLSVRTSARKMPCPTPTLQACPTCMLARAADTAAWKLVWGCGARCAMCSFQTCVKLAV